MPIDGPGFDPPEHRQHTLVTRNDSLRSDRSDKRVSFNKDVGVKHIPRGQKNSTHSVQKGLQDEWANCAPVQLEKVRLSSVELEKQAEELVRAIDNINCVSGSKPVPHPAFSSRSLDKNKKNKLNNLKTLNNEKDPPNNTNNIFGKADHSGNKENIYSNKFGYPNNIKYGGHLDTSPYKKFSSRYLSVPDVSTTIYYNNTKSPSKYLIENNISGNSNFKSLDNLQEANDKNIIDVLKLDSQNRNKFKSVDNLGKVVKSQKDFKHKQIPYQTSNKGKHSTSINIEAPSTDEIDSPKEYIMNNRFGSDTDRHNVLRHHIYRDESPPRNYKNTNEYQSYNNGRPFNYTSDANSSINVNRHFSPSKEIPIQRDNTTYAQINKPSRKARSSSRDYDPHSRNTDSDYSAKIIITRNSPTRFDGDDHAYETYQVGNGNFLRPSNDYGLSADDSFDEYRKSQNANMNMSSIGVQTEKVPKPPQRSRRSHRELMNTKVDTSDQDFQEHLPSAALVRRINHGFGRIDRSPSPPRVKRTTPRMHGQVVPLLSDTDDSEYDFKKRVDPMAKIRNQVMMREHIQEARESQEREEEIFNRRNKMITDLNSELTADDIDALALEVDKKGRSSRIMTHENGTKPSAGYNHSSQDRSLKTNDSTLSRGRQTEQDKTNISGRSKSPGIFSTLERIKNNSFKSTLERNKDKEKKKKKIKIKFFYDPRLQDKPNEDPLDRYTEYKGDFSDSPDASRQRKDYSDSMNYYGDRKNDYSSLSREARNEKERRYRYDSSESPSRDNSRQRPIRYRSTSRDRSVESGNKHTENRFKYNRDSSHERSARKYYGDNTEYRNKDRPNNYDSSLERRMARDHKSNIFKSEFNDGGYQKKNHHVNGINSSGYSKHRSEERDSSRDRGERRGYVKKLEFSDETDHHEFSDAGHRSLSEKFSSLSRKDPSSKQKAILKNSEKNETEDEDKKEKIERQRKKFFGVLSGEGKTKFPDKSKEEMNKQRSPSETRQQPNSSSTLTRSNTAQAPRQSTFQNRQMSPRAATPSADSMHKFNKDKKSRPAPKIPPKQKQTRSWPWSFLKIRRSTKRNNNLYNPQKTMRISSRPSSRASSRASSNPRRPTVRSSKIRRDVIDGRSRITRDRDADDKEKRQWESATHIRSNSSPPGTRRSFTPSRDTKNGHANRSNKYITDSSPSLHNTPVKRVGRTPSFQERYFGESDRDRGRRMSPVVNGGNTSTSNYQSLPNPKARSNGSRQNMISTRSGGIRKPSPVARGSAGSSLQSSESEADSHGGSHASRASHISTGSNRSVYLHATAVADIPVRRSSDESPSERGINRQSRRVARSFSLASPWKPRHYRDKYEVEYDNGDLRDGKDNRRNRDDKTEKKNALPPRPPRKSVEVDDYPKKMGRSQTVYKDSKLAGWLRRKKNKEMKGI